MKIEIKEIDGRAAEIIRGALGLCRKLGGSE